MLNFKSALNFDQYVALCAVLSALLSNDSSKAIILKIPNVQGLNAYTHLIYRCLSMKCYRRGLIFKLNK